MMPARRFIIHVLAATAALMLPVVVSMAGTSAASITFDQSAPNPTGGTTPADPSATGANSLVACDGSSGYANAGIGEEVVHSWALVPAGDTDASGAGNRPNLSYTGDPGSSIEDAVTLLNLGNEQLTFHLYATDALNDDKGEFALLDAKTLPTDVGTWVSFGQSDVTVGPCQSATIPMTITIPADAAPGDHAGGVLASNPAISSAQGGGTVVLDRRTGSRVYLRVNGPLRSELAIEKLDLDYSASLNPLGGSSTVTYRIKNRGNVRLSGTAKVSVAGPLGIGRKSVTAVEFPELLPGQGATLTANVSDVPALLIATAKVDITPKGVDSIAVKQSVQSASAFAPPITLMLLMAFIGFGLLARRAHQRHQVVGVSPRLGSSSFRS